MDIKQIFSEVSTQMRADFSRSQQSLSHTGLKGGANEEIVRQFFRQYFPKTLDVTSGTLVDSAGGISKQLDIILSDAAKSPIFFQAADVRVIPVECAYSVIEVKAYLDKKELERCYENMNSCKSLKKCAYFEQKGHITYPNTLFGTEWPFFPLSYFVFAFDSIGLESIVTNLSELQKSSDVHQRIDAICTLDKGVVLNRTKKGLYSALPEPEATLICATTQQSLLLFYAVTSIILNQARMPNFNIQPYIQKILFV